MSSHEEAVAAMEALDEKVTWEGMTDPLVVKWAMQDRQKRARNDQQPYGRGGACHSTQKICHRTT